MKVAILALVVASLSACSEPLDGEGDGPCTEDATLCATVHVPSDYMADPRQVIVGLYDQLPPTTPPFDVPLIVDMPDITVEHPVDIMAEGMDTAGDYFVYVALYNVGGGQFVPEAGIDYVWFSDAPIDVGHGPVNLGDIMVHLHEE